MLKVRQGRWRARKYMASPPADWTTTARCLLAPHSRNLQPAAAMVVMAGITIGALTLLPHGNSTELVVQIATALAGIIGCIGCVLRITEAAPGSSGVAGTSIRGCKSRGNIAAGPSEGPR